MSFREDLKQEEEKYQFPNLAFLPVFVIGIPWLIL